MKINSKLKNGEISFSKGKGTFTIKIGEVVKPDKSKQSSLKKWFEKLNKIYLFIISSFLIVGCGDYDNILNSEEESESYRVPLDVYMKYEQDENGYYKVGYSGFNYVQVFAQSEGIQRIFWSSSDSFTIVHMGIEFHTSIASYSTYTNSQTGETRQNVYVNQGFIGDTLVVVGAISEDNYDYVYFILH